MIADTHGLVRPAVFEALAGVSRILHAGDVGGPEVLVELRSIAPVQAVSGNTDDPHQPDLEPQLHVQLGGVWVHVSHGDELGSPTPVRLLERYRADVIVFGHTHTPLIHREGSRLVVNPGSAGPRRFNLQPSVARLTIEGGQASAEILWLPG